MSDLIKLNDEQKRLIEKLGVHSEKEGVAPASGRIIALLMVSPEVELSFDQIRETLNLSKSATSNALNMLLSTGKIDYITQPGERKRYFKNKIRSWREEMKNAFGHITMVSDLFEEVLEQRPADTTEFNDNLRDLIDFLRFMKEELPSLYMKWEAQRKG